MTKNTPRPVGRPATGQGATVYLPHWLLPHARALLAAVKAKDKDAAIKAIAALQNELGQIVPRQ